MSIPDNYHDIINGLLIRTRAKEVRWNTSSDSNTFMVYFANFSLGIYLRDNQQDESLARVELINNNGEKIDDFWINDQDGDWKIINDLFSLARRSALSIDVAIQEMLTEINKNGMIGEKKSETNGFADDIPF
jgi:hypothetical protein